MKIFNYTFTNSFNCGISSNNIPHVPRCINKPISDTFERSSQISFTSDSKKERKSVENNLKNLEGLHDPYSNVVLLTPNKKDKIYSELAQRDDVGSILTLMNKYSCHMFEPEKVIFNKLNEKYNELLELNPKAAKKITLSEMLSDMLPESKLNLVNQQLDIFDTIRTDAHSRLSKPSQHIVYSVIDDIVESIYTDEFRTKKALSSLDSIRSSIPEKREFLEVCSAIEDLPRSATSSDVFVVKNYSKTDADIAMALISPAEATIEHIQPQSARGADTLNNYIVASKRMNNIRSSNSLEDFVKKYPNIPKYTQKYMNDLITKVNSKDLKNIGMSIPDVKAQLYKQSNGLIDVDISTLDNAYIRAAEEFNINVLNLVDHFS